MDVWLCQDTTQCKARGCSIQNQPFGNKSNVSNIRACIFMVFFWSMFTKSNEKSWALVACDNPLICKDEALAFTCYNPFLHPKGVYPRHSCGWTLGRAILKSYCNAFCTDTFLLELSALRLYVSIPLPLQQGSWKDIQAAHQIPQESRQAGWTRDSCGDACRTSHATVAPNTVLNQATSYRCGLNATLIVLMLW